MCILCPHWTKNMRLVAAVHSKIGISDLLICRRGSTAANY
jgi:hypothetical protein